jgi:hypothetical protein
VQDPPKFTQIWNFGLKTNHLATLVESCFKKFTSAEQFPTFNSTCYFAKEHLEKKFKERLGRLH